MMQANLDPQLLLSQALLDSASGQKSGNSDEQFRKVSQEFEAILVQTLFKSMRATITDGGLFEKSMRTEIFDDLMDMEISRQVSTFQSPGMADALYRQMAAGK